MCILDSYYHIDMHTPGKRLSASGLWTTAPADVSEHKDYVAFIEKLPLVSSPEVFSLHENATITKDQKETVDLFDAVLTTQASGGGGGGGGGKSRDDTIGEVAHDILARLPPNFDLEAISSKYPVRWDESMNTVLCQELERFNRLTTIVRESLRNLQRAIKGLVVMSPELEAVGTDLFFGRVPKLWMSRSYPSLKPLSGYVGDLLFRLETFQKWVDHGPPPSFWLPGLFFTQSFLTGALQNYARKYTIAIDNVGFHTEPMREAREDIRKPPADGVCVYGMFLDGCKWDHAGMRLADSEPKVLFAPAPVIWLKPMKTDDLPQYSHYVCPVYKTSERRGTLSTTGHSTNFVMAMKLPSDVPEAQWIQRGVAMLLQLDN